MCVCVCVQKQVDASSAAEAGKKKRRSSGSVGGGRRSQYDVRMVDEITDDDLENVAYRSKDKIWDKENVGGRPPPQLHLHLHLHPCLAAAHLPLLPSSLPSGQLVPPVPAEDSGH